MIRTFDAAEFDAAALANRKGDQRISLCLPARNEEATVGHIVAAARKHLVEDVALLDEIVVVDDHSTDRTAELAASEGARVVHADRVLRRYG